MGFVNMFLPITYCPCVILNGGKDNLDYFLSMKRGFSMVLTIPSAWISAHSIFASGQKQSLKIYVSFMFSVAAFVNFGVQSEYIIKTISIYNKRQEESFYAWLPLFFLYYFLNGMSIPILWGVFSFTTKLGAWYSSAFRLIST